MMLPYSVDQLAKLFPWAIFMEGLRLYGGEAIEKGFASKDAKKYKFHIRDRFHQRIVRVFLDDFFDYSKGLCDCESYMSEGVCSHIVCAALHIGKHLKEHSVFGANILLNDLMSAYETQIFSKRSTSPVHFDVTLTISEGDCRADFKIGREKMYVLRRIQELFEQDHAKRALKFGEHFTYYPESDFFDSTDQSLFELLKLFYEMSRPRQPFGANEFFRGKYLHLNGASLRMMLQSLHGKSFDFIHENRKIERKGIRILQEDPKLQFMISEEEGKLFLKRTKNETFSLTSDRTYVYHDATIYFTSIEFRHNSAPFFQYFLDTEEEVLEISPNERSRFVEKTLHHLTEIADIAFDNSVTDPPCLFPMEVFFHLDREGVNLVGDLTFRYGEFEISALSKSQAGDLILPIIRDSSREEMVVQQMLDSGFLLEDDRFRMSHPDDIYSFLSEKGDRMIEEGWNVFYSEDVKRMLKGLQRTVSAVISFPSGLDMLEINFDLEGVSKEEYFEMFSSLKLKKKFYRMKNGDFVSLQNREMEALYDLEALGEINWNNLENGTLRVPKYRALYLDSFIRGRSLNHIEEHADVKKLIDEIQNRHEHIYELPKEIRGELREYQLRGYYWLRTLERYGFGGILADEMGLGKTVQMIAFIQYLVDKKRGASIVIVPTSLLYNWESEFEKFAPNLKTCLVTGSVSQRERILKECAGIDVFITSYALIRNDWEFYEGMNFASIVLDEAQYIKNALSMNSKAVKKLRGSVRFALTGTPMENSLAELHSVFDFLMPGYLFTARRFHEIYRRPIMKDNDETALKSLKEHVRPFLLRRLKKDVLKELPEKFEQALMIDLNEAQKKLYKAYLEELKKTVEREIGEKGYTKSRFKILSALTRLRQICADPSVFLEDYEGGSSKMDSLEEMLEDLIRSGNRILLFSSFTSVLRRIEERLRKAKVEYRYLDGSTPSELRKEEADAFNRGEGQVFLISLKAGGTGLNLTSADTVIHYDPWWNPAVEDQATDRAHRIGQEKTVQVLKLISKGTVEEKIYELQHRKKDLIDRVVEDGEVLISAMSEEEIRKIFEI